MNVLRGKTKKEILYDFTRSHRISDDEWKLFSKHMKNPFYFPKKHRILLWTIPLIMFGLSLGGTLLSCVATEGFFPLVFDPENITFYKRIANVYYGMVLIVGCFACIIVPIIAMLVNYEDE